jgi:hypothetical protein
VLAFHTELEALRFCLAAQTALLTAQWSGALLATSQAAPLSVEVDAAAHAEARSLLGGSLFKQALKPPLLATSLRSESRTSARTDSALAKFARPSSQNVCARADALRSSGAPPNVGQALGAGLQQETSAVSGGDLEQVLAAAPRRTPSGGTSYESYQGVPAVRVPTPPVLEESELAGLQADTPPSPFAAPAADPYLRPSLPHRSMSEALDMPSLLPSLRTAAGHVNAPQRSRLRPSLSRLGLASSVPAAQGSATSGPKPKDAEEDVLSLALPPAPPVVAALQSSKATFGRTQLDEAFMLRPSLQYCSEDTGEEAPATLRICTLRELLRAIFPVCKDPGCGPDEARMTRITGRAARPQTLPMFRCVAGCACTAPALRACS